jgi:macrolide-specific efflux system membrane fusion protein
MGVARKWVFPIIRILVFAAIAVALVKLAFFSGATQSTDPALPTGHISEPQTTVALGTITNDVTLKGTVSADAAVAVKATLAGEVRKILVTEGQGVVAKTPVLIIRSDTLLPDGTPTTKSVTVLAGSAGTLSSLPEQYRLLNQPTEATVTITGGPAPFVCGGLAISTALAGSGSTSGSDSATNPGTSSGGTTMKCAVPAAVKVFGGLAASMKISGGRAEGVLVVPITAVDGTIQSGNVYMTKDGGQPQKHPVTLGLSDGKNVQVTGGVKEGDQILEFVPGGAASSGACTPGPNGAVICQGSGK